MDIFGGSVRSSKNSLRKNIFEKNMFEKNIFEKYVKLAAAVAYNAKSNGKKKNEAKRKE